MYWQWWRSDVPLLWSLPVFLHDPVCVWLGKNWWKAAGMRPRQIYKSIEASLISPERFGKLTWIETYRSVGNKLCWQMRCHSWHYCVWIQISDVAICNSYYAAAMGLVFWLADLAALMSGRRAPHRYLGAFRLLRNIQFDAATLFIGANIDFCRC